jgi:hypothetical protein
MGAHASKWLGTAEGFVTWHRMMTAGELCCNDSMIADRCTSCGSRVIRQQSNRKLIPPLSTTPTLSGRLLADSIQVIVKTSATAINQASNATAKAVATAVNDVCNGGRVS